MNTDIRTVPIHGAAPKAGLLSRVFTMSYAIVAYGVGAGSLFWFFFAAIGVAPDVVVDLSGDQHFLGLLVNLLLVATFGFQHSLMARPSFKKRWTRIVPEPLERSTYVLFSGLFLVPIIMLWQSLPGVIWQLENESLALLLTAIATLGFGYLLFASFLTNHFELFGLRQAWLFAMGKPYTPLDFQTNWLYRFSRHPIMAGLLIVFWATPDMTVTRFVLAVMLTVYVFVGVKIEERTLIQQFGETYTDYQRRVGMFFTFGSRDT